MRRAGQCAERQALLLSKTLSPCPRARLRHGLHSWNRPCCTPYRSLYNLDRFSNSILSFKSIRCLSNNYGRPSKDEASSERKLLKIVQQLDVYLPERLAILPALKPKSRDQVHLRIGRFLNLFEQIQGQNVLVWMVKNGHEEAAVWLIKHIQSEIASTVRQLSKSDQLPSNIAWPSSLLPSTRRPRESQHNEYTALTVIQSNYSLKQFVDDRHVLGSRFISKGAARAEAYLWRTIADLILESSCTSESTVYDEPLTVALLAISNFHSLGLMPDSVYKALKPARSSHLQRPPVLELLSGRIFTALSDAVWRDQQNDAIVSALEQGKTLDQVARQVPGGRFRLRVRPLGPEIWMELVLWTCVDLGYHHDAATIVHNLNSSNSVEPWFAAKWCSSSQNQDVDVHIDWDRIKNRTGGTLGRIEGYSADKPLVDVPPKTISVEVVLALVDGLMDGAILHKSHARDQLGKVMRFLEPHNLGSAYFDYLQTKPLINAVLNNPISQSGDIKGWCALVDHLYNMESIAKPPVVEQNLSLAAIQQNTLLPVALKQQAMHFLIQAHRVHDVLPLFNILVEYTDKSKYESIAKFISGNNHAKPRPAGTDPATSTRLFGEYSDHGQIPMHILAALLNLLQDSGLSGLGQWMVYATDIDGPLIDTSAFRSAAFCASLFRFAGATNDNHLLLRVVRSMEQDQRMPSVRTLRAKANAEITLHAWKSARSTLAKLRNAKAGGYGLSNLAHVCIETLRLSQNPQASLPALRQCVLLLEDMLRGAFNNRRSDFSQAQTREYGMQTSHILRVVFSDQQLTPILERLLAKYADRLVQGNTPSLPADVFNPIFAFLVESQSWERAKLIYQTFCVDPSFSLQAKDLPVEQSPFFSDDANLPFATTEIELNTLQEINTEAMAEEDLSLSASSTKTFQDGLDEFDQKHGEDNSQLSQARRDDMVAQSHELRTQQSSTTVYNLLKPMPVTVPNLQTLRILIARYAHTLKSQYDELEIEVSSENTRRANKQQERSQRFFLLRELAKFGVHDREILEQELQEPVSDLDLSEVAEPPAVHAGRSGDFKRIIPSTVSQLWAPKTLNVKMY